MEALRLSKIRKKNNLSVVKIEHEGGLLLQTIQLN